MKNINSLITGSLIGISVVFVISGLLQYIFILGTSDSIVSLHFSMLGITPEFQISVNSSNTINTVLLLSKLLFVVLFTEIFFLWLKKNGVGFKRNFIIVAVLFQVGFVILFSFFSIAELLLSKSESGILRQVVQLWKLEGNQIYVLFIFSVLILFAYLQSIQKRLVEYISVDSRN